KENLVTTTRSSVEGKRPPFRTTQGIRITPGLGFHNEETVATESSTPSTTVTAQVSASVSTARVSASVSNLTTRKSPSVPTTTTTESRPTSAESDEVTTVASSVHVAPTRSPPIPQMTLLEGSEDNQADGGNNAFLNKP
ncbi:unnamed protein product, partial [Strongylus vulgaris]